MVEQLIIYGHEMLPKEMEKWRPGNFFDRKEKRVSTGFDECEDHSARCK